MGDRDYRISRGAGTRDSGLGTRDSGLGTRDSGLGTRDSGSKKAPCGAFFDFGTASEAGSVASACFKRLFRVPGPESRPHSLIHVCVRPSASMPM
ncbi:hypothetical protein FFY77_11760 [Xanthomonas translucens pv. translucens]|nr:hypothetical protein [Xanthomonas translucens pv. translucens]